MARVTVEDCLKVIPNRFILALIAAKRTRQLLSGHKSTINKTDNKPAVISLREIEEGKVTARDSSLTAVVAPIANGNGTHS